MSRFCFDFLIPKVHPHHNPQQYMRLGSCQVATVERGKDGSKPSPFSVWVVSDSRVALASTESRFDKRWKECFEPPLHAPVDPAPMEATSGF